MAASATPLSSETAQGIAGNTALVIRELGPQSGLDFGLNAASVEWLEGFIERQRAQGSTGADLTSVLGSFLGDAIIAAAGGAWAQDEAGLVGVLFDNGDWCFPFAKVAKQFENGADGGDSITGFYRIAVEEVASGRLGQARGEAPVRQSRPFRLWPFRS